MRSLVTRAEPLPVWALNKCADFSCIYTYRTAGSSHKHHLVQASSCRHLFHTDFDSIDRDEHTLTRLGSRQSTTGYGDSARERTSIVVCQRNHNDMLVWMSKTHYVTCLPNSCQYHESRSIHHGVRLSWLGGAPAETWRPPTRVIARILSRSVP